MSVQDLSCWHDRRTVDNAHGRSGYLSFQQFDRATDRAEAPASVTDGAPIPSARQLGSSTDSRSEPIFRYAGFSARRFFCPAALFACDMIAQSDRGVLLSGSIRDLLLPIRLMP